MRKRRATPAVLALACIAALPVVADTLRRGADRCALDGVVVATPPAACVIDGGRTRSFCCVRCAELWIAREGAPAAVRVIDGPTGGEIDARSAWFVRSLATWSEGPPDSIRAFARRSDAERHVRAHGGRLLEGRGRPFAALGVERDEAPGE